MSPLYLLRRLMLRLRYPNSLPEDIGDALGINIPENVEINTLVNLLLTSGIKPSRINKFMCREKAELAFSKALRKERFANSTLFSFYFNEGWVEFSLHFDEHSRLRRLYLNHKCINETCGLEVPLNAFSTIHLSPFTAIKHN